jgi:hypothetical protein
MIDFQKLKTLKWKRDYDDMPCWQKAFFQFIWFVGTGDYVSDQFN